MTWSKSASGTAAQVKGTCGGWADEQKAGDNGMSQEAVDGQQQQVQGAANCIVTLVDALPEGTTFSISAFGHHDGDPASAKGGLSVNYSAS